MLPRARCCATRFQSTWADNERTTRWQRGRRRRTGDRRRRCACLRGVEEPACGSVEEVRSVLVVAMGRHNEIVRTIEAVPEEADTAHSRWGAYSRAVEGAMHIDGCEIAQA